MPVSSSQTYIKPIPPILPVAIGSVVLEGKLLNTEPRSNPPPALGDPPHEFPLLICNCPNEKASTSSTASDNSARRVDNPSGETGGESEGDEENGPDTSVEVGEVTIEADL